MICRIFLTVVLVNIVTVSVVDGSIHLNVPNTALDQRLYEEVLDPELCEEQLRLIRGNAVLSIFFADAGMRLPKGILQGNTLELGNYHQCIGFNEPLPDYNLQGKYCMIRVPIDDNFHWPNLDVLQLQHLKSTSRKYYVKRREMLEMTGIIQDDRSLPNNPLSGLEFRMATCIPKPCTTEQALNSLLFNLSDIGFTYTDEFCRLANDKPWVPGDYVAVGLFSLLGLITIISTTYDVWQTIILEKDSKQTSVIGRSFSVYTNGRRLMTFTSGPDTIECLDGIRALAMAWIIIGHGFSSVPNWLNPIDALSWAISWQALWVIGAHVTVDTFFMLSGFLVVYTTVGKLTGKRLLKNIHLFYLNRLLRMFPILAAAVLIEATLLNHMTDGPEWRLTWQVEQCRTYWWSTLLHMQNWLNPRNACIGQSWYLVIDVQLHILSPIILVWIYGNKKTAWAALLGGLCSVLVASTIYNVIMEFPTTSRGGDFMYYTIYYYTNILARASPFFVGMVFGYLVKVVKLEMTQIQATFYWVFTFSVSTFIIYSNYPILQPDWDNQLVDSLFNSFVRPLWAFAIGLIIYACVNGYGGPINWFLSLNVWKIPSRISYAMYLFHYGLMITVNYAAVTPPYFSVASVLFKFLAHYSFAFVVSFIMTLLVDSPFSVLFKLMLGGGVKKSSETRKDTLPVKESEKQV